MTWTKHRVWDMGDPEPEGVSTVVEVEAASWRSDDFNSSPSWGRTTHEEPDMRWKGYVDGEKVYLSWDELTRRHGPVREP